MSLTQKPIAIVVHGGAGPDSEFILKHLVEYKEGLSNAMMAGYEILEKGGSAIDAVEAAVRSLEDNIYFNAGRGSALTADGHAEMCASMMEGKKKKAGAAAIIRSVRNPISFARAILENPSIVYIGGEEADETAKDVKMDIEPYSYFITEHQWDVFEQERKKKPFMENKAFRKYRKRSHGTVGAVALDSHGNLAAGTSTGGTEFDQPGRIGDSSMIGVGTYADNNYAAVSCTGDGECLIREVLGHSIVSAVAYTSCTIQEAMEKVINQKCKDVKADLGAIGIDSKGNIGMCFNSDRMHRAWKTRDDSGIEVY